MWECALGLNCKSLLKGVEQLETTDVILSQYRFYVLCAW